MVGLSINESTRAAATDGALSFSILVNNQRELTIGSAHSAVTGLLSAIRTAPEDFSKLLDAAAEAVATQETAALKLVQPPWTGASTQTTEAIRTQLNAAFATLLADARNQATQARNSAEAAASSSGNPSTERTLATQTKDAGDLLLTAFSQLETGDDAAGLASLESARSQATTALTTATAHLNTLQATNPLPVAQIAATQAVIASANSIIDAANDVQGSSLTRPAGETATTYELTTATPPTTYLTVYGTSGSFALTDASGQGVLISSDGKVDTIPPSGQGWQFNTDSTFLLPDGTKVSVDPGSPASVLVTRGQQRITIDSLQPGSAPSVELHSGGGLAADKNRNDGYIFEMGGDPRAWTLAGSALGDTGGAREVVATSPLTNEVEVDVTTTTLPPELVAFLTAYGIDPTSYDKDGDGAYSNEELRELVATLESAVGGVQLQFDAAISNTASALQSLLKLNQFIEKILAEADKRQADRRQLTAEERDQLLVIQADLAKALATLRTESASDRQGSRGPVAAALSVLEQIGAPEPTEPEPRGPAPTTGSSNDPTALGSQPVPSRKSGYAPPLSTPPPPSTPPPDPGSLAFAQSLRRAERLLSGFSGGAANLRFVEPPPGAPGNVAPPPDFGDVPATKEGGPTSEAPLQPTAVDAEGNPLPLPLDATEPTDLQESGLSNPSTAEPGTRRGESSPAPSERETGKDVAPIRRGQSPTAVRPPDFDPSSELSEATLATPPTGPSLPTDPLASLPPGLPANLPPPPASKGSVPLPPVGPRGPLEPALDPSSGPNVVVPVNGGSTEGTTPVPRNEEKAEPPGELPSNDDGPPASTPGDSRQGLPPSGPGLPPLNPQMPKIEIVPPALWPNQRPEGDEGAPVSDAEPVTNPTSRAPDGRPLIPGNRFSATGPDPFTGPDPTSGATGGFSREYGRRLDAHRSNYEQQLHQSRQLQTEVRQVVERFLVLVGQDEQLRQVFSTNDLSDEQRDAFKTKVESLERELGVTWGGDPEKTPQAETKLSSRILTSGMMI